jgi:hypothetical protein
VIPEVQLTGQILAKFTSKRSLEMPSNTVTKNTRQINSEKKLAMACAMVVAKLVGKDWVSSNAIHVALASKMSEPMFGRVKNEMGIVHRRVKDAKTGKAMYQWKLPENPNAKLKAILDAKVNAKASSK